MTMVDDVRGILDEADRVFAGSSTQTEVIRLRTRLDEPLRVAIAGKVKAGKSTLLNALVGELLAPTDTGECTKVVTWYRDGHSYQVMLHPADGSAAVQARFSRDDGAIDVDLGSRRAVDVDRLEVTWPSGRLRTMTLIDTPGVDSLTEGVATRAFEFLDPDDNDTPADAVLYLMKHIHASDLRLLEAFHDDSVSSPSPVNAIAVLSRADEIGAGRADSMDSAARIAARLGDDPRLRRLVQMIVPVAGLLAETAETLTESEYRELASLAERRDDLEVSLLSTDRFVEATPETPLTSLDRERLLGRFGLFGLRTAIDMIADGTATTSQQLSEALVRLSGLVELRSVLNTLFLGRTDVLKARSAMLGVERLCHDHAALPGVERLASTLERLTASAHPFNEMNTMAAIRSGWISGNAQQLAELERLLGANGTLVEQRLGLDAHASADEVRSAAAAALSKLQRSAENPLTTHDLATAIRVVIRTLEGILADAT
jgi:hypothetical protein